MLTSIGRRILTSDKSDAFEYDMGPVSGSSLGGSDIIFN